MLKKTIKYTDYNGVEREEEFYFNLSKAELTQMELETPGGMMEKIKGIINAKDVPSLIKLFTYFIEKSYGEKSADGRRFVKSQEILENFKQTEAYSTLYMELVSDDKAAADFINGIIPVSQEELEEAKKQNPELAAKLP